MAGRPLIGVSTYLETARWGVWELEAALLPAGYPRLVQSAGGLAAMLPPDEPGPRRRDRGPARRPGDRGRPRRGPVPLRRRPRPTMRPRGPRPRHLGTRPDRRRVGLRHTPPRNLPRNATPERRARRNPRPAHRRTRRGRRSLRPPHGEAGPGLPLRRLDPRGNIRTDLPPPGGGPPGHGLTPSAHAADGTIEAIELPGPGWVLGVQWHPEMGEDPRVMSGLVRAAS
jgi:putative glutamine amidotransferase